MSYLDTLRHAGNNASGLEAAYRTAVKEGQGAAFTESVRTVYGESPDNLLYAAWFHRLAAEERKPATNLGRRWALAVPLAIVSGLLYWWVSDDQYMIRVGGSDVLPLLILLWAPVGAAFVMLWMAQVTRRQWLLVAGSVAVIALAAAYALYFYPALDTTQFQRHYLELMAIHLPLLAWIATAIYVLGGWSSSNNRFSFLIKSLEVFIMAGLFGIAGGLFVAITVGLFDALSITLSQTVMRLLAAGGAGLIPVVAVAAIYDPDVAAEEQSFDEGLSKVVATLMRMLLPFTLLVLAIYLGFIPFRFLEPFQNRDVLIIYNAMLFAVMALLLGATPVPGAAMAPALRSWLRRGLVAVAVLAAVVSIYALSAIGYRTLVGGLTPNRLTFIGWNVINIGILLLLLYRQWYSDEHTWTDGMRSAFGVGVAAYVVWDLVVIIVLPWLF